MYRNIVLCYCFIIHLLYLRIVLLRIGGHNVHLPHGGHDRGYGEYETRGQAPVPEGQQRVEVHE